MRNKLTHLTTCFLFILASCAQMSEKTNEHEIVNAKPAALPMTTKSVKERMSEVIEEARNKGPDAVQYLASDLWLKANDASIRGDNETAAFLYSYVLELNPSDSYVKKKYSVELIRIGQMEKARELLEDVYTNEGHEETVGLILAGLYGAMNQPEKSLETYEKILKDHPNSEEACLFLSKSYAQKENDKKAFTTLDKCQKSVPDSPVFSYFRGKIYFDRGKEKKAVSEFKKSLKIDPQYFQSALALGAIKEEKGDLKGALKIYREFLEQDKMSFPILTKFVQLKFATAEKKEDYREIIPYAERLSSIDPSDLNLKVRLGILYTDSSRYQDAIGIFKEVLSEIPDSDKVLYYLGTLHNQIRSFEPAIEYYGKIGVESPLYNEGVLQVAQILREMVEGGLSDNDRFLDFIDEKSQQKVDLKFDLQMIKVGWMESSNQISSAITELAKMKTDERFDESHLYYLASLHDKNKDFPSARAVIQEIIDRNPKNAHAWNFLGYSLLERNEELETAFECIQKAVELQPADGYIRDSLGWYYYVTGNYEKALGEIKKAHELVDDDPVIAQHLAMVYQKLEKYQLAKKFYQKAMKLSEKSTQKEEIRLALEELEDRRFPASR